jgi:hypothetical protein
MASIDEACTGRERLARWPGPGGEAAALGPVGLAQSHLAWHDKPVHGRFL